MSGPPVDTPAAAPVAAPAETCCASPGVSSHRGSHALVTLKRRREFLSVRGGARWATRTFVLEARPRTGAVSGETASSAETARFGFTVSKQVGGAVERNRIKRRLKAATRDVLLEHARHNYDYVLIARRPALDAGFAALVSDLAEALKRVHARGERPRRGPEPGPARGRAAGG